jgi:metallo-beta-lactamase family protein
MAINATHIYCKHAGEHRLNEAQCGEMFSVADMVKSTEASKALNTNDGPAVIVSASGMATGGRVVHHLKTLLPYPDNTIVFAGFQAPGTRGDALVKGAETVKIHGEIVRVRAEILDLDNMSAHADYEEMLEWMGQCGCTPSRTFITHGEPDAAQAFHHRIEETLGWKCHIPAHEETVELA